jgi:hypothetical protein
MQQSRLDKFFMIKKSATIEDATTTANQQTNKRLSTTENENSKKLKRTKSDPDTIVNEDSSQSNEPIESSFSLNQFYLDKFLLILSSSFNHHKYLFYENELILLENFQTLSSSYFVF